MDLKYFSLDEFASPDEPGSGSKMCCKFLKKLDKIRADFGAPLRVNSGFRSVKHNALVGGRVGSSHLKGIAVDFRCTNSGDRTKLLKAIYKAGIVRVGIAKNFIHIDTDNNKGAACWLYN
tara:strand:+ start:4724 stop:5083 length:360 start_codon:yes stop_codon:yes gene_type:complete